MDGGPASDEDDGELPEFSDDGEVEQGQAGDSSGIDAGGGGVPMSEEGAEPVLRNAPVKPDQEEVDRHYATHIPRRLWCPVCVQASLEEDPHFRAEVDHKDDGVPMVCMDYKELEKGRPLHIVIRERATGRTYGAKCLRKGPPDAWLVTRLAIKIGSWGLQDTKLWVKSDGEPAIKALQRAIGEERRSATELLNSPVRDPQSNGVAERAVKE